MRTELFMHSCIKNYIGTQDEGKIFNTPAPPPPPPTLTRVYITDRSKVVVPVFFLFCVTLLFILRGASCLVLLLCPRVSSVVCVLLVHLFVNSARVNFCPSSFPLDVRCYLLTCLCPVGFVDRNEHTFMKPRPRNQVNLQLI